MKFYRLGLASVVFLGLSFSHFVSAEIVPDCVSVKTVRKFATPPQLWGLDDKVIFEADGGFYLSLQSKTPDVMFKESTETVVQIFLRNNRWNPTVAGTLSYWVFTRYKKGFRNYLLEFPPPSQARAVKPTFTLDYEFPMMIQNGNMKSYSPLVDMYIGPDLIVFLSLYGIWYQPLEAFNKKDKNFPLHYSSVTTVTSQNRYGALFPYLQYLGVVNAANPPAVPLLQNYMEPYYLNQVQHGFKMTVSSSILSNYGAEYLNLLYSHLASTDVLAQPANPPVLPQPNPSEKLLVVFRSTDVLPLQIYSQRGPESLNMTGNYPALASFLPEDELSKTRGVMSFALHDLKHTTFYYKNGNPECVFIDRRTLKSVVMTSDQKGSPVIPKEVSVHAIDTEGNYFTGSFN